MSERYKKRFELPCAKYADEAPVLLRAGALLEDSLSHTLMVQLKLQNISNREVIAAHVRIDCLDPAGDRLELVDHMYQGFSAPRDQFFAQKTAIVITDTRTSSFVPSVTQVVFSDGTVWNNETAPWDDIKSPRTLLEAFGDEQLVTQFSIRYGNDCTHQPDDDRGLWFCTCGLINRKEESKCHGCRRVYSAMKGVNIASLRSESLQRQEAERQTELELQKEQSKKKSKVLKKALYIIPILLCLAVILSVVPHYQAQKNAYQQAVALLSSGRYDQAQEAFRAMGNYADSAEQAEFNVPYEKACYIMRCAQEDNVEGLLILGMKRSQLADGETVSVALYKAADQLFSQLGDYKDSLSQREMAQKAVADYYESIKLAEYDAAAALLAEGSYLQARDAFLAMEDYKDSSVLATECEYLRALKLLEFAEAHSTRGIYTRLSSDLGAQSIFYVDQEAFSELGSSVTAELREILQKDGIKIDLQSPADENAVPFCQAVSALFEALGDYKDSKDCMLRADAAGDFTRPFYEMCASGRLSDAYIWLSNYTDPFDYKAQWLELLEKFIPYCGVWVMEQGDPTLISQTMGSELACGRFTSLVTITDSVITLKLYVNDSADFVIEMPVAAERDHFTLNYDGINTYIAAINNRGHFTYSKYSNYAIQMQTLSCEYSRSE